MFSIEFVLVLTVAENQYPHLLLPQIGLHNHIVERPQRTLPGCMQIDRQVDRQTDKKFSNLSVRSPAECAAYALECARAVRAMGLSLRAQTGHALCMLAQAEHLNLSAQHHSRRDRHRRTQTYPARLRSACTSPQRRRKNAHVPRTHCT